MNTGSFLWFSTSPFCRTGPTSDPASLQPGPAFPRTGLISGGTDMTSVFVLLRAYHPPSVRIYGANGEYGRAGVFNEQAPGLETVHVFHLQNKTAIFEK